MNYRVYQGSTVCKTNIGFFVLLGFYGITNIPGTTVYSTKAGMFGLLPGTTVYNTKVRLFGLPGTTVYNY